MADLSDVSTADLQAYQAGNLQAVSTPGLLAIQAALGQGVPQSQTTQPPGNEAPFLSQLGRQTALTGRGLLQGALSLPATLANGLNLPLNAGIRGINDVAGTNIPQFPEQNQAVSSALSSLGLPEPQSQPEKDAGFLSELTGSALGGVPVGKALMGTANPLLQAVGENLAFKSPDVAAVPNKKQLAGQALSLGSDIPDASNAMGNSLDNAYQTAKDAASQPFKDLGINETTPSPTAPLKTAVDNYISNLPKANSDVIPSYVKNVLGNFNETEPLSEIQALRSRIGGDIADTKNPNSKRILGGLSDIIGEHADSPDLSGLTPEQATVYQQARSGYRQFKQIFNQPDVLDALGTDKNGYANIAPEDVARTFIKPSTQLGAKSTFDGYLTALGQGTADTQSAGMDAARTAFADRFNTAIADGKPKQVQNFVKNYSHIIQSSLLNDAQRQTIQDVSASVINSKDSLANKAIGLLKNRLITGAAGAALGGETGGWRGALEGAGAGAGLAFAIKNAPSKSISGLISAGIKDPQIADALQMSASKFKSGNLPAGVFDKIKNVLLNPDIDNSLLQQGAN